MIKRTIMIKTDPFSRLAILISMAVTGNGWAGRADKPAPSLILKLSITRKTLKPNFRNLVCS